MKMYFNFLWIPIIGALILLTGCATTGEKKYSDIPWTEPWDGTPSIPGMSPGY